jgi:hypothetical protein
MLDIKDYLSYGPETGLFTWVRNTGRQNKLNKIAGHKAKNGYVYIQYKTKRYLAHRLAWYFYHGVPPLYSIDHINEAKDDNRICNLRLDTDKENGQNNSTCKGMSWSTTRGKWQAAISIKGVNKFLGYYDTPEEARDVYLCAKREHHPFWVEGK